MQLSIYVFVYVWLTRIKQRFPVCTLHDNSKHTAIYHTIKFGPGGKTWISAYGAVRALTHLADKKSPFLGIMVFNSHDLQVYIQ